MQSRLRAIAPRSNWALWVTQLQGLRRGGLTTGRTADPSVHANDDDENDPSVLSGEPERSQDNLEPDNAKANYEGRDDPKQGGSNGPFGPSKAQHASSPRLETTVVGQASKPITQQKRAHSVAIDDVSCIGVYGGPLEEGKESRTTEMKDKEEEEEEEEIEDNRDYYKHHKASPLAEIEFVDTRKPITRATDGTADYGDGKTVIGWLPEQVDTVDDSLRRATEIWKQNAMRGDPDAPQSRVLRALRGEDF
ncbi:uncharacterized protein E5676_scaffold411G001470 [Cucumis melo var. makuwa]|uniref:Uncharacterized protein n=1 Tax=Cucumis melo var. makuwa TaxID=1194695 RepID=A0A5D3D3D5_CUCMM|nr:uncharacterized protein E6C27_scaffold427G00400 [Cucumis melo var. makuwa]TYK18208.1 uncharacterized protein E5676_scaffold411G001470 [Cucumis melo var. makuwa]